MVGTKKIKYFHVRGKMRKLARLVGRGNTTSIARYVVNQPDLRKRAIDCVITLMKRELTTLSSDTFSSILREKSQTAMEFFTWESVWQELSSHAPTLLSVLQGITSRRSINIARAKPVVCVCAAILLKLKNPKMCHIQAMLSLLLHAGHSSRQVVY